MASRVVHSKKTHRIKQESERLAKNIKALRSLYGFTQAELGAAIGRNRNFINYIERVGNIGFIEGVKLALFLGVSPKELLDQEYWIRLENFAATYSDES